jgi:hypothetical protein
MSSAIEIRLSTDDLRSNPVECVTSQSKLHNSVSLPCYVNVGNNVLCSEASGITD